MMAKRRQQAGRVSRERGRQRAATSARTDRVGCLATAPQCRQWRCWVGRPRPPRRSMAVASTQRLSDGSERGASRFSATSESRAPAALRGRGPLCGREEEQPSKRPEKIRIAQCVIPQKYCSAGHLGVALARHETIYSVHSIASTQQVQPQSVTDGGAGACRVSARTAVQGDTEWRTLSQMQRR